MRSLRVLVQDVVLRCTYIFATDACEGSRAPEIDPAARGGRHIHADAALQR
jgi:hypothetical protein